jgi:hypothetical protein
VVKVGGSDVPRAATDLCIQFLIGLVILQVPLLYRAALGQSLAADSIILSFGGVGKGQEPTLQYSVLI